MSTSLPVSDLFLSALRGSHGVVIGVTLCSPPGQTGVAPTGRQLLLADSAGSVTLDGDAVIRGTLDLSLIEAWPTAADSTDITPYGAEVFVTRGVELGNGVVQRAPLGYFRLNSVEQPDAPFGPLRVTGQDRMAGIVDARFEVPVQFLASSTYGAVVTAVVTEVYPGATIEWDDATDAQLIGRSVTGEQDRYAFLLDVIQSIGKIMFFDYRGVLVIKDPPDASVSVWSVNAGKDGVLVELSRSLSREQVYNAVIANGEALDDTAPPFGAAYDLDPASPTYYEGPYGKVPRFYGSPLLTTSVQASSAAASLLAQSLGLPYSVDFTSVPNPALEPFDPVEIVYPLDLASTPHVKRETHVLSSIRIPLDAAGAMPANTRKVTL